MRLNKYFIGLVLGVGLFYACDKEKDFLRDNTSLTGVGSVPVSTNALLDVTANPAKPLGINASGATVYATGASFDAELQFFSDSPVKEINQFNTIGTGTRTKTGTWPYAKAFSNLKKLDTLLVPYTVPAAASGTVIKLDYEILNQNSLNVIRTVYVKVQ